MNSFYTQESFSTGEAAKICRVSQQTIIRCFDTGILEGSRLPGSRFRKIPRKSLLLFMRTYGLDASIIGEGGTLVVGSSRLAKDVCGLLKEEDGMRCSMNCQDGFSAGMLLSERSFDFLLIDAELPKLGKLFYSELARPAFSGVRVALFSTKVSLAIETNGFPVTKLSGIVNARQLKIEFLESFPPQGPVSSSVSSFVSGPMEGLNG